MLRRVLAAFGVVFVALGVAVVVAPSVTDVVRLPDVPSVVVGAFALLFAIAGFAARRAVTFEDPETAAVRASGLEDRFEPPRPGAEIDAELTEGPDATDVSARDVHVRERLRILAVRTLTDAEDLSVEEANERLQNGTWTDDRTAAAMFCDDVLPPAEDVVATVAGIESAQERKVRHALAEIERRSGIDTEGD